MILYFVIVLSFYLVDILAIVFGWFSNMLFSICRKNGIFQTYDAPVFEKKFTEKQLADMAKNLPSGKCNLNDIMNHFSISYRQARLVKSELMRQESAPNIQQLCV